jgi:hypothetical protein
MRIKPTLGIKIIVSIFLLLLPYIIFQNKLFIGGDDTRLFYIFPDQWINSIGFYSWFHFSTFGINNPNQFIIPFLSLIFVLNFIIKSKVVIDYLFFSLPLILGFIFFQKFLREFITEDKYKLEIFIAALFYIFSPILMVNQLSVFLYAAWLIGGVPLLLLLLVKFINTGSKSVLILASVVFIFLALIFASVPWLLGFFLPAFIPLLFLSNYFSLKDIKKIVFRTVFFFLSVGMIQAYWIIPFVLNFLLVHKGSFSSVILSQTTGDTFSPTVLATAIGNILYPLLNLFHRDIAFVYNWQVKDNFLSFYDSFWYLNLSFVFIIGTGLFLYKKFLPSKYKIFYLYSLLAFVLSLFLFTVNVDILKELFLLAGKIPGFVMFRNFYDKFAFGFVFFYAVFIAISLIIFNIRFAKFKIYTSIVLILIVCFFVIPIKQVVDKSLWKTKNTYTIANFPKEYTYFITSFNITLKGSEGILSLPYNIAAYTFVPDDNPKYIFIGTSPVVIFTGNNDFSGDLSFKPTDSELFKKLLLAKNYSAIQKFLAKYAINYVFVTNNIPTEVKKSYLFEPKVLEAQNNEFLRAITGKRLITSSKGNYELFQTNIQTPLISGPNIEFRKLSPVKFQITIRNLKQNETIDFRDTYNYDWKLYPEKVKSDCSPVYYYPEYQTAECAKTNSFSLSELQYLFAKHISDTYHMQPNDFGNTWEIDHSYIKNNVNSDLYTVNKDGSINISFTLYFLPQTYFYLGTFVSIITLFCLSILAFVEYRKKTK